MIPLLLHFQNCALCSLTFQKFSHQAEKKKNNYGHELARSKLHQNVAFLTAGYQLTFRNTKLNGSGFLLKAPAILRAPTEKAQPAFGMRASGSH